MVIFHNNSDHVGLKSSAYNFFIYEILINTMSQGESNNIIKLTK